MKYLITIILVLFTSSAFSFEVKKSRKPPKIDGIIDKMIWQDAEWRNLNYLISGEEASAKDFSGRFKVLWDDNYLYILAEITDDVLYDGHPNPLDSYWDDDCLEIFIDEDNSGGEHKNNFNAFAYHIALDNQIVDIAPNVNGNLAGPVLLNDHAKSVWRRKAESPNEMVWEVRLSIFNDTYKISSKTSESSSPVKLTKGKLLGFMLAYCDNDGSKVREHFYNSIDIEPVNHDKNRGYVDADVFEQIQLISSD